MKVEQTRYQPLVNALKKHPECKRFISSFTDATGIYVSLQTHVGELDDTNWQNPFCKTLNEDKTCQACRMHRAHLHEQKNETLHCFAQLAETVIYLKIGDTIFANLLAGQVFLQNEPKKIFRPIATSLKRMQVPEEMLVKLEVLWKRTEGVTKKRYDAAIRLLEVFASQISRIAADLMMQDLEGEPEHVRKAKHYILQHHTDPIMLEDVAKAIGFSNQYASTLFRDHTGITISEHISLVRIEAAKRQLLLRNMRIAEIAYQVGFCSLSQFNRTFSKLTGQSPSQYRSASSLSGP
ncbi:MAG: helix-turn-helix domain-containing protein [Chthoniobacterales bacterium]